MRGDLAESLYFDAVEDEGDDGSFVREEPSYSSAVDVADHLLLSDFLSPSEASTGDAEQQGQHDTLDVLDKSSSTPADAAADASFSGPQMSTKDRWSLNLTSIQASISSNDAVEHDVTSSAQSLVDPFDIRCASAPPLFRVAPAVQVGVVGALPRLRFNVASESLNDLRKLIPALAIRAADPTRRSADEPSMGGGAAAGDDDAAVDEVPKGLPPPGVALVSCVFDVPRVDVVLLQPDPSDSTAGGLSELLAATFSIGCAACSARSTFA